MSQQYTKTLRGFGIINFQDYNDIACSLQESSLGSEAAIWLGPDDASPQQLVPGTGWQPVPFPDGTSFTTRMHLTQEQVRDLLPYLKTFAEIGTLSTIYPPIDSADALFNCCTEAKEPDWSQFTHLELAGCVNENDDDDDETCINGNQSAEQAQFFTVYGRDKEGLAEAITDIDDARRALQIAAALSFRSCLTCRIATSLM